MSTWEVKRKTILKRDNYTCQGCGQFNPELGTVQFYDETIGEVELHEYSNSPNPYDSNYMISQSRTGYTLNINFGDCWPVFPIMQVHHNKYINGREYWDYDDSDLVTLCKKCHHNLHLSETIPIYSSDEVLLEERMFLPVDQGSGRKHNAEEWTFIKKVGGGEYTVSDLHPTITMVLFSDESQDHAVKEGKKALRKFLNQFFPRYRTP